MCVAGLLVEEDRGPRHGSGLMVVVRDHVEQLSAVLRRAAVNEESLIRCFRVNGDGDVLLGVSGEPAAVFVGVPVFRGLVHVPDATVAGVALQGCSDESGRRKDGGGEQKAQWVFSSNY